CSAQACSLPPFVEGSSNKRAPDGAMVQRPRWAGRRLREGSSLSLAAPAVPPSSAMEASRSWSRDVSPGVGVAEPRTSVRSSLSLGRFGLPTMLTLPGPAVLARGRVVPGLVPHLYAGVIEHAHDDPAPAAVPPGVRRDVAQAVLRPQLLGETVVHA